MYIFTPNTLIKSNEVNANFTELKAKTDYLSAPDSAWHNVGGSGEPAFQNSWVNYDTAWQVARFRKDAFGYVHLEGLVRSGTANVIFTLPVGYRPTTSTNGLIFATINTDTIGRTDIKPDGSVSRIVGGNGFVSLSGITFKAEQ